jgi:hypothetical protein
MIEFTLSLSKGLDSGFVISERFVETTRNPSTDSEGGVFTKRGPGFNSLFLKILFFLTFSLDKNNIGCPTSLLARRPTSLLIIMLSRLFLQPQRLKSAVAVSHPLE